MASRYNFSVQRYNQITNRNEIFQVIECNSWEEARKEVEKAIRDQDLIEKDYISKLPRVGLATSPTPFPLEKTTTASQAFTPSAPSTIARGLETVPSGNKTS